MNVSKLLWDVAKSDTHRGLPILSFPAAQKLGVTVEQLVKDSRLQAQAIALIASETDTLAAAARILGEPVPDFGRKTAMGALGYYISNENAVNFQPMNVNFGIIDPLEERVKGKANKNLAIANRALAYLESMRNEEQE